MDGLLDCRMVICLGTDRHVEGPEYPVSARGTNTLRTASVDITYQSQVVVQPYEKFVTAKLPGRSARSSNGAAETSAAAPRAKTVERRMFLGVSFVLNTAAEG